MSIKSAKHKAELYSLAHQYGFDSIGVAKAEFLQEEAPSLEKWLKGNLHGTMKYMENHFDKRLDPRLLHPGTKTVVMLSYNYFPKEKPEELGALKIARYAYGRDYHKVIKKKLKLLVSELQLKIGEFSYRYFVDSAPVLERQWAAKAGLGWQGKNSLLLTKQRGSYFFLATLLVDLEFDADSPTNDFCGTCTKCIDACPTDAIIQSGVVDSKRCISYLTIEHQGAIDKSYQKDMKNWVFGCDICQEVCPWNRFSRIHNEQDFLTNDKMRFLWKDQWKNMSEDDFNEAFQGSAVKRTQYSGFVRNVRFITKEQ